MFIFRKNHTKNYEENKADIYFELLFISKDSKAEAANFYEFHFWYKTFTAYMIPLKTFLTDKMTSFGNDHSKKDIFKIFIKYKICYSNI